jgi:hypothetical protein
MQAQTTQETSSVAAAVSQVLLRTRRAEGLSGKETT